MSNAAAAIPPVNTHLIKMLLVCFIGFYWFRWPIRFGKNTAIGVLIARHLRFCWSCLKIFSLGPDTQTRGSILLLDVGRTTNDARGPPTFKTAGMGQRPEGYPQRLSP